AAVTTGMFPAVNGAPGGGPSGVTSVVVGYPVPKITSVSPNTSPLQSASSSGSLAITITGSGFLPQAAVRVGRLFAFITSVTPTQILAGIPNSNLTTPGSLAVTVQNPLPGGGTSNSVDFSVTYPVPTIAALSPDSAFTGAAFTLTVNGTGFGTGSIVRWNGTDRQTTFVSA